MSGLSCPHHCAGRSRSRSSSASRRVVPVGSSVNAWYISAPLSVRSAPSRSRPRESTSARMLLNFQTSEAMPVTHDRIPVVKSPRCHLPSGRSAESWSSTAAAARADASTCCCADASTSSAAARCCAPASVAVRASPAASREPLGPRSRSRSSHPRAQKSIATSARPCPHATASACRRRVEAAVACTWETASRACAYCSRLLAHPSEAAPVHDEASASRISTTCCARARACWSRLSASARKDAADPGTRRLASEHVANVAPKAVDLTRQSPSAAGSPWHGPRRSARLRGTCRRTP
ncbi:hypothetical protein CHMI_01400 [Cellulomonas hominis]|nr:hypothetical protein CHMI_01400 [Cellulomonas hominis]